MTGKLSNGPMRRLCLFLAAFLLLATMLCGCGPAPVAPTQPTAPTQPMATPTEPTQPPAPSGDGPVVISAPDIAVPTLRPNQVWSRSVNTSTGSIVFSVPEELFDAPDIHFLITVDAGAYTDKSTLAGCRTQLEAQNHTKLYWICNYDPIGTLSMDLLPYMEAHTRVIICDGQHIIGYIVLRYDAIPTHLLHLYRAPEPPAPGEFVLFEPSLTEYGWYFKVVVVESVIFPKIDGQHQDIPLEYIQARFDDSCLCWKSDLSGLPE